VEARTLVRVYLEAMQELPVSAIETPSSSDRPRPDGEILSPRPLRGYLDFVTLDWVIELQDKLPEPGTRTISLATFKSAHTPTPRSEPTGSRGASWCTSS